MATSVHDVAAAVVARHHPIDQLKLQKIIYFAAGEYAALTGQAMFPEPIEAWDYGPVVHEVWKSYRHYEGDRAISEASAGDPSALNDLEVGCIESALEKYGERSGANLIDITHGEAAWKNAYVPGQLRTQIPVSTLVAAFRDKGAQVHVPEAVLDQVFATQSRG